MSIIVTKFAEQPIFRIFHKLVEGRKVWLTEATAFAAAKERVDTVRRRNESETTPCRTGVEYFSDND